LRQEWVPEGWAARGLGQLYLARVEPLPRRAQASFPGPVPRVGFPPVRELSRLVELLLCPSLLIQKLSEQLEWRRPGPPAQLAAAAWRVWSLSALSPAGGFLVSAEPGRGGRVRGALGP